MSKASVALCGVTVRYDGRSTITVEGGDGTIAPLATAAVIAYRLERAGVTFLFENDRLTPMSKIHVRIQSVTPVVPAGMAKALQALPNDWTMEPFRGIR